MAVLHHRFHGVGAPYAATGPQVDYIKPGIARRRPGVAQTAPETLQPSGPGGRGVQGVSVALALPPVHTYAPRARVGTVPKLAPGARAGLGLGAMPYQIGAANSPVVDGWTALDYGPPSDPDFCITIPPQLPGDWTWGAAALRPTYRPKNFTPATRFFNQARSTASWAQATLAPKPLVNRPLIPSQQPAMLSRTPPKLGIASGQRNAGLYAFGYPTQASIAARLGVGPVAVLGGNSA